METPAQTIQLLEAIGIPQGDIARELGRSQALVCMVKHGKRRLHGYEDVMALKRLRRRYARKIAKFQASKAST